jgi:nucleoside-diphosphate-sugar epimerase
MNILVTGGCGYIGDCVVENLLKEDCNVTVVDNLMYGGAYLRRHIAPSTIRKPSKYFNGVWQAQVHWPRHNRYGLYESTNRTL